MSEVAKYYDEFTELQVRAGINNRHISIIEHLQELGLKINHHVLEIGCGIGTVSELILRYLSKEGFLHAVDISPKSVALARHRLKKYSNSVVEVNDLTKNTINNQFDVVVLPDVIEHIPIELHPHLFLNIKQMLRDDGFVFIHIPNPNYLEWMVNNKDEGLQIIDQPIHTDELCSIVYTVGFYLEYLKSYSIYTIDNDYQIIVLRKKPSNQNFSSLPSFYNISYFKRLLRKIRYISRGLK